MPTIARAKRSAGMPGWAGLWVEYGIPIDKKAGCMARNHVRVGARNAAGMKQVQPHGCAVCVPASLRLRDADGFVRWHEGAFRVGAPPQPLDRRTRFWRAARYATVLFFSRQAFSMTQDRPSKHDRGAAGQRPVSQTRRWNWWLKRSFPNAAMELVDATQPPKRGGGSVPLCSLPNAAAEAVQ